MTKEQLLAVEQNLSIKQQEIIQMRQDIEAHKEYIDNQTASELANRLSDLYKDYSVLKSQIAILKQNEEV